MLPSIFYIYKKKTILNLVNLILLSFQGEENRSWDPLFPSCVIHIYLLVKKCENVIIFELSLFLFKLDKYFSFNLTKYFAASLCGTSFFLLKEIYLFE
jgi:hypothetical protein